MITPNCCANCVQCTRIPPFVIGGYPGGTKYHCRRFKRVVDPYDENCKVHERYVEQDPEQKKIAI
jgi:hypothetical protein